MFKWLPDVSVGWRDVWLGASIVVVLIWVYYTSQMIDGCGDHPQLCQA